MKTLFWHRKNKVNARGQAPIYCRITINGIRGTDFTTGIFCSVGQFNAGKQIITGNEIESMKLANIKHKINAIFLDLDHKGETITPELIKEYLSGRRSIDITLSDMMDQYIDHQERLVIVNEISERTLCKRRDTVKNIRLYLDHIGQRNITLKAVSAKFGSDFYYWLQESKKVGPEYAAKTMTIVKAIINFAIMQGDTQHNPLCTLRFKRGARKRIEFLKPGEIDRLQAYHFRSEKLQQVADLFLLQCFTGFAYADLSDFSPKQHIETDEQGREWIVKPRAKNGLESVLPLFPEAKQILHKYSRPIKKGNLIQLPVTPNQLPLISNQKYNVYLKEIGDILGFDTVLTTHIGRKTFGTIALNNGYSIESVSRMLGHTNIKTTQGHYAVVLKMRMVAEL